MCAIYVCFSYLLGVLCFTYMFYSFCSFTFVPRNKGVPWNYEKLYCCIYVYTGKQHITTEGSTARRHSSCANREVGTFHVPNFVVARRRVLNSRRQGSGLFICRRLWFSRFFKSRVADVHDLSIHDFSRQGISCAWTLSYFTAVPFSSHELPTFMIFQYVIFQDKAFVASDLF